MNVILDWNLVYGGARGPDLRNLRVYRLGSKLHSLPRSSLAIIKYLATRTYSSPSIVLGPCFQGPSALRGPGSQQYDGSNILSPLFSGKVSIHGPFSPSSPMKIFHLRFSSKFFTILDASISVIRLIVSSVSAVAVPSLFQSQSSFQSRPSSSSASVPPYVSNLFSNASSSTVFVDPKLPPSRNLIHVASAI
jgi:hypothetical protein